MSVGTSGKSQSEFLDYHPFIFLRCHSRNKDPADVHTQVWQCAFEPNLDSPWKTTSVVATCGGNSVCFIDCNSGQILNKYYTKNARDLLFSLAWTTLKMKQTNILAAAGSMSTIHLIDRYENKCILEHALGLKRSTVVHSLLFHPITKSVLFCGASDGIVRSYNLEYGKTDGYSFQVLGEVYGNSGEVFDLAYSLTPSILLASSNDGLLAFPWIQLTTTSSSLEQRIKLLLPQNPNFARFGDSKLVDSVEVIGRGMIACKCALHGNIYICDITCLKDIMDKKSDRSVNLIPKKILQWDDSDNYFMYMGLSTEANLLACGGDKGSIWIYDMTHFHLGDEKVNPICILVWPELSDKYGDRKRKLKLQTCDIVVDKVVVNSSGDIIVSVTNNNMVCVWKRNK